MISIKVLRVSFHDLQFQCFGFFQSPLLRVGCSQVIQEEQVLGCVALRLRSRINRSQLDVF